MPFLGNCHLCGEPLSVELPDDDEFSLHPENTLCERMGCVIFCPKCLEGMRCTSA
jgi:hypothetical protein